MANEMTIGDVVAIEISAPEIAETPLQIAERQLREQTEKVIRLKQAEAEKEAAKKAAALEAERKNIESRMIEISRFFPQWNFSFSAKSNSAPRRTNSTNPAPSVEGIIPSITSDAVRQIVGDAAMAVEAFRKTAETKFNRQSVNCYVQSLRLATRNGRTAAGYRLNGEVFVKVK